MVSIQLDVKRCAMEMDMVTRVQMLGEFVCISHNAYSFGKSMNPTILPPAMGK